VFSFIGVLVMACVFNLTGKERPLQGAVWGKGKQKGSSGAEASAAESLAARQLDSSRGLTGGGTPPLAEPAAPELSR
jgi:hypothetical protein